MDHLFTPWRFAYISGEDNTRQKKGVPPELAAWPGDLNCVFCNMLAAVEFATTHGMSRENAENAIFLLERREHCFLVLNAYPYSSGHLMIVPYQHQSSLAALPAVVAQDMMTQLRRAERVLRKTYKPDGLNAGLNLGESAGAGVADHLHIHALPRWTGDANFMSVIAETRVLPEMLTDTWKKLRAALAEDAADPPSD